MTTTEQHRTDLADHQIDIRVNLDLQEGDRVSERELAQALCRAIDDLDIVVGDSTYTVVGIEDVD